MLFGSDCVYLAVCRRLDIADAPVADTATVAVAHARALAHVAAPRSPAAPGQHAVAAGSAADSECLAHSSRRTAFGLAAVRSPLDWHFAAGAPDAGGSAAAGGFRAGGPERRGSERCARDCPTWICCPSTIGVWSWTLEPRPHRRYSPIRSVRWTIR